MRINVYSQELTEDITVVSRQGPNGEVFSAVRLHLHSADELHADDGSAITIWLPKSEERRRALATTLERMAIAVRFSLPET